MTQGLLGRVVGRLDTGDLHERPQVFLVVDKFLAKPVRARVEVAAQKQRVDLPADRLHPASEGAMRESAVADLLPEREHFLGRPHEVMSETFLGWARTVDEGLEIAFEMRPAPLEPADAPV